MKKIIVGKYKTMGGIGYLTINNQGTMKKMGKIKWYFVFLLRIKQIIHKKVKYSDVEKYVRLSNKAVEQ
jgi:hypothetical protein